jgi:hypothetical protein
MGAKLPVRFNLLLAVATLLDELMPCLVPLPEQIFLLRLARLLGRLLFRSHLCIPSYQKTTRLLRLWMGKEEL